MMAQTNPNTDSPIEDARGVGVGRDPAVSGFEPAQVTDSDRALFRELERFVFQSHGGPGLDGEAIEVIARHRTASAQELELAVHQYRNDLLYPPAPDSVERRLAMIDALLAKSAAVA